MKTRTGWRVVMWFLALALAAGPLAAAPPWSSLLPFKRIDADPQQSYELREEHGPWLILAASFAGEEADQQARELVLELRQRFRLPAYIHRQLYDFTEPVQGRTINRYGEWARMRYANASRYEAIAVLVGDFESVNDPALEKTLEKIKFARPDCLDIKKRQRSAQRFAALREWYRQVSSDPAKRSKGPMGSAFVTRNPLLPASYFVPEGVDTFVVQLNRGVKHSLLDNPGNYTVRVATFRGKDTINQREIQELARHSPPSNKLEIAAENAHRLTMALRERGEEAYEFHDRNESIVTIGSFQSEGTPLPDGAIEIDPGILRIMQTYGAARTPIPNQPLLGLQPRSLAGIPFDIQPMPIKVPRRSIAKD